MSHRGSAGGLPRRGPLAAEMRAAIARLRTKLLALNLDELDIADYSRRYLAASLLHGGAQLNVCGHVLLSTLRPLATSVRETTLIDYGGGNGLISLLARELGVGIIVYNDIFDAASRDAQLLAEALDLEGDHYVVGDLGVLISYLRDESLQCDAICSYDVIEHVYDIDGFLAALPGVSDGPLRVVMASAANGLNPRRRRQLMTAQRQIENEDRHDAVLHKERDSRTAYRRIRAQMIREHAPSLAPERVEILAGRTRGLASGDIARAVDVHVASGGYPPEPGHPTNTCDPATGNWAEHLMDPFALASALTAAGVITSVEPGYYGFHLGWRGAVATALNTVIRVTGRQGLRIAPYYMLAGNRR